MERLICCDSCQRHARISEPRCPFCDVPFEASRGDLPSPSRATARNRRGLAYALSAGLLGAAAVGCADDDPEPQADAGIDAGVDAGMDAGVDAGDAGWPIPIYGAPPPLPGSRD